VRIDAATALVTGGSRGIGRATAEELTRRGARVVLVARPSTDLAEAASDLGAVAVDGDLTDRAGIRRIVARAEAAIGPIDILVNNAALVRPASSVEMTDDALTEDLECNLVTPMRLVRQLLPGMLERRRGHIVNVSSGAAALPLPNMTTYCASKAGLLHYTASLRSEIWNTGVGTTVVELGTVPGTQAYDAALQDDRLRLLYARLQRVGLMSDTSADQVARKIATAVERERPYVRVPRVAQVGWRLNSAVRDSAYYLVRARGTA